MSLESIKSAISEAKPGEFAAGVFDAVVQTPWNLLSEWAGGRLGHIHVSSSDADSASQKAGFATGQALNFAAVFALGTVARPGMAAIKALSSEGALAEAAAAAAAAASGKAVALPEVSASVAAERIARLYPELEPRIGMHLTDPNVVLTLGNARGDTEFFVHKPIAGAEAGALPF